MRSRFSLSSLSIRMSGVLIATNGFHSLSSPLIMVSYNLQPPAGVSVYPSAEQRAASSPGRLGNKHVFHLCREIYPGNV